MKKINKEGIKSDKGFTMIELIIVIAILGILAAILVPSFTTMTTKSRLKSDISTARQVQTQIDLYVADHDGRYPDNAGNPTATKGSVTDIVAGLVASEYLKGTDATAGVVNFQTAGTTLAWNATAGLTEQIEMTVTHPKALTLAANLSVKEAEWVNGITGK